MVNSSPPAGRGERSRQELTDIAIDCFSRFGFQGTSVDRIAKIAGVTKGAIYYHFRDKNDLLRAAVSDRVAEFEERVQTACADCGPAEALRRIADVCIKHAQSNDHPRFAITLVVETIDTNDQIAEQLRDMMRRFRAFLRNLIRSGQDDGVFVTEIDAEVAAANYVSAVLGAEVQYYQDPERFAFAGSVDFYLDHLIAALTRRDGDQ